MWWEFLILPWNARFILALRTAALISPVTGNHSSRTLLESGAAYSVTRWWYPVLTRLIPWLISYGSGWQSHQSLLGGSITHYRSALWLWGAILRSRCFPLHKTKPTSSLWVCLLVRKLLLLFCVLLRRILWWLISRILWLILRTITIPMLCISLHMRTSSRIVITMLTLTLRISLSVTAAVMHTHIRLTVSLIIGRPYWWREVPILPWLVWCSTVTSN